MSTDLIPFSFEDQPVRVVTIDGEPWFVAADVTALLGYAGGSRNAIASLPERMKSSVALANGTPGNPNRTVINEAGVNRLIMRSTLPDAERVQDWLAEDVLPSLRKTGSYSVTPALTDDEKVHEALQITASRVQALTAQVTEMTPKAEYHDVFVADGDLKTFRTVAADVKLSESGLRDLLIRHKWIYSEEATRWSETDQCKRTVRRYSAYADKKQYFTPRANHDAPRFRGEVMHTLKITPAGALAVERLVRNSALISA